VSERSVGSTWPGRSELGGVSVEDGATVGATAIVLPGVTTGLRSFGAGVMVIRDVPPDTFALGAPATHESLPDRRGRFGAGRAVRWSNHHKTVQSVEYCNI
jgi:acetyltransferase-like isoleucine patch superfamily enzyme